MNFAVLGTGDVGRTIASKLVSLGHATGLGSRTADNDTARSWSSDAGDLASHGTFHQVSAAAHVVFLCVKGEHALSVVEAARTALAGKVLVDLTNPLDFSRGFPPRLTVCNDDSLGEQIQRAAPEVRVVKTLNTLANTLMVDPGKLAEPTDVFVAGDDADAKATVAEVLRSFGHSEPVDLGGINAARGLEAWLLLWTRLYGALGTDTFNLRLVRG